MEDILVLKTNSILKGRTDFLRQTNDYRVARLPKSYLIVIGIMSVLRCAS